MKLWKKFKMQLPPVGIKGSISYRKYAGSFKIHFCSRMSNFNPRRASTRTQTKNNRGYAPSSSSCKHLAFEGEFSPMHAPFQCVCVCV